MGYIRVLDDRVSELISAGEVVERPASVVKELVENSIDAGATKIEVELRRNGIESIKVTDNGKGIAEDDIKVAFLRHATSKIRNATDLEAIGSLGFRGEALAAIASVSKVRLISRTSDSESGFRYELDGGKEKDFTPCGAPIGTSISVDYLFYNTPARMKFLKKDVAEGNAVETLMWHIALTEPDISFKLVREGKTAFRTSGQGLYAAIYDLFPREIAANMLEIKPVADVGAVSVNGYISAPRDARASRSLQHISVNGRYIKSRAIQSAVEEACRGLIMQDKYPAFALNILLPFDDVDVNVHPAKTEIRFKSERAVTSAVYHAVKAAVSVSAQAAVTLSDNTDSEPFRSAQPVCAPESTQDVFDTPKFSVSQFEDKTASPKAAEYSEDDLDFMFFQPQVAAATKLENDFKFSSPDTDYDYSASFIEKSTLNVIGELFGTYIVAESGDQMLLIDMHAAHERILFEKLRKEHTEVDSQLLLEPFSVSLSAEEKQMLLDNAELLRGLGFAIEDFGGRDVAVREIPTYLKQSAVESAVAEMAQKLVEGRVTLTLEAREWLLHSVACRAAIKAGHKASKEEMVSLASEILLGNIPKFCPHGRPVYVSFSRYELEKRFGRAT